MNDNYIVKLQKFHFIHLKHLRKQIFEMQKSKKDITLDKLVKINANFSFDNKELNEYKRSIPQFIKENFEGISKSGIKQILICKGSEQTQPPKSKEDSPKDKRRKEIWIKINKKIESCWENIGPKNSKILPIQEKKVDYEKKLYEFSLKPEEIEKIWKMSKIK